MMRQLKITSKITPRDSDLIKIYFGDISKTELLTKEQEVELAQKIKTGDKKALNTLVSSNLRFVISVAKQYQNRGLEMCDLINEGNIGLIRAAQKFDETKGFKFISYAVWWIRQSILLALSEHSNIVKLPANQLNSLNKIRNITPSLQQQFQREPTVEELSESLNEDQDRIKGLLGINKNHVSLDSYVNEDENQTYLDILPFSVDDNDVERKINDDCFKNDLERVLNKLRDRNKEVLCMYFGVMGHQPMNLEEIGKVLKITRERVRQIRDTSIRMLRQRKHSIILRNHFY
jgi:RNA polymerase primary sigma factor